MASVYPRQRAPLPHQLQGPDHAARLPLADRVRERPPVRRPCSSTGAGWGATSTPTRPSRSRPAGCARGARTGSWSSSTAARTRDLPEGWWNWGGIVRPVRLMPAGAPTSTTSGRCPRSSCRGPATGCRAKLLVDGVLQRSGAAELASTLEVQLRSPSGRVTRHTFRLARQPASAGASACRCRSGPGAVEAGGPEALLVAHHAARPRRGATGRPPRRRPALGDRQARDLYLNNRRVELAGASIHEDMPGRGAALTGADMDRIVADLKELGANVTRSHYLLNERLLKRFDRAGIMVWNQAPIWQRDRRANVLGAAAAPTRAGDGEAQRDRGAQPPLGDHPLGGQRAVVHAPTA